MAASRSFNLLRTIEAIVELVSVEAAGRGLEIETRLDPDADRELHFDAWRVQQIASHLLANAIANAASGTVSLSLCRDPDVDGGAGSVGFVLVVEDNGPAIERPHVESLFATDSSDVVYGPGVALSMCRDLADAANSEFSVGSLVGGGAWASLRFTAFSEAAVEPLPEPLQARLQRSRALVVDPDPDMRGQLIAKLGAWGVRSIAAPSGLAACDAIHAAAEDDDHFTMVFVDSAVREVDMHGILAALQMSRGHRTTVLVATGVGDEFVMPNDLARRSQALLESPVRLSQLFDCLAQMNVDSTGALRDRRGGNGSDGHRVLVVEDNIVNQCVAVEMLRRLGALVDVAENGGEAVAAIARADYDLVFMDCHMPVMDGFDAARQIRAGTVQADVPIVALTACALPGDRERCLDAGMNDFLCKPFTRRQIERMLEKWIPALGGRVMATETTAGSDDGDILNRSVLSEIMALDDAGDDSIFQEILAEYLASSAQLMARLDDAVRAMDADEIGRCAHALKSSSAALGARRLAACCRRLEERARMADMRDTPAEWKQAQAAFRRTIDALGTHGRTEQVA